MPEKKAQKDESGDDPFKPYTWRIPMPLYRRMARRKAELDQDIQDQLADAVALYFEQLDKGKQQPLTTELRRLIEDFVSLYEHGEAEAPFMRRVVLDALMEWRRNRR